MEKGLEWVEAATVYQECDRGVLRPVVSPLRLRLGGYDYVRGIEGATCPTWVCSARKGK